MKKILFLLILMISLTGCMKNEQQIENGEVNLEFWIPGGEEEYGFYYAAAREYTQQTEGVTITPVQQPWSDYWTKLPLEINNGRGPGIFISHPRYSDILLPISAELNMTSQELKEIGYTNTDLFLGENGNPMFIPVLYVPNIIYYNTNMWSEAGLTEEDIPTNWKQIEEISLLLADEESDIIGFDFGYYILYDLAIQNGQKLFSDNHANFYKEPLDIILEWEEKGITNYMGYGAGDPEESFPQEAAAMIYGQPWMANYFENTIPDLQFKTFPVPSYSDDTRNAMAETELSPGINKNLTGEEMEVAQDFVLTMLKDEETMVKIANGNNGASANENYLQHQQYEEGSAGSSSIQTINDNEEMFLVIPQALEDSYIVLLESTISQGESSIYSNIEDAKASTSNLDLTLSQQLEDDVV